MNPITVQDVLTTMAIQAVKAARHDEDEKARLNVQIEALKHELDATRAAAKSADDEVTRLRDLMDAAKPKEA